MNMPTPQNPLRPLALAVSSSIIVACSLLVSAASLGRPQVSGYGIDHALIEPAQVDNQ